MWRTLSYVERNPVRAKIVRVAWRYLWSIAAAHATGADASRLLDMPTWLSTWRPERWKPELRRVEDKASTAAIRLSTSRGRPLAGDSFLSKLEHRLGRRVRALPVGRPKQRVSTDRKDPARPKGDRNR